MNKKLNLFSILLFSCFVTVNAQIATIPYSCNFEDVTENAKWIIPNLVTTNPWVIDAKTSGSLVYSADFAKNTVNTNSTVPVYREFNTVDGQEYIVTFDWKALGESAYNLGSSYNGLYVYWVDDPSVNISDWTTTSATMPQAAAQYQKYQVMRQTSFYQSGSFMVTGNGLPAKLVFLWVNNGLAQNLSGGSIDNINIIHHAPAATAATSIHINQTNPYKNYTPEQLVKKVFVNGGDCLISNVVFSGLGWNQGTNTWTSTSRSLAYFDNGTIDGLGMEAGLLLTTGDALEAAGPNNSGSAMSGGSLGTDANLQSLIPSGNSVYSVSRLEFDMVPYTNTLTFDYIFASEEYPEWSCSSYNDVFGFFISGPGIAGSQNIALIPYTNTPVAIAYLHPNYGSCSAQNAQFYVDGTGNAYTQFDGHTKMFSTAPTTVIPGQTYHLKLAIANVGGASQDIAYGSGVFLRAGSLELGSNVVSHGAGVEGMENVFAGCEENYFSINIVPYPVDVTVTLSYSGAAVNDVVSLDGSPLPTSITIPPGTSQYDIPYIVNSPVTVNGGDLNITVTVEYCSDANAATKTIYVFDKIINPEFEVESTCDAEDGVLHVNVTGEGSPALKLSIDDTNIWHSAYNFSTTLPAGIHQVLFKDSISCNIDTFEVDIPFITSTDTIIYDTISMGDPYTKPPFNLPEQNYLGTYEYSATIPNGNIYGCDSIVNLVLTVQDILVEFLSLDEICGDDTDFNIDFHVIAGTVSGYSVVFDTKALAAGFENIINQALSGSYITVALPDSVRPDIYSATIKLTDGEMQKDFPFEFTVLYPSSIMTQRWNDVLALLNDKFNGGYKWSSYQWYKNDEQIPNETGSYLYVGANGDILDTTAMYRAKITRIDDGVTLFTCPVAPVFNQSTNFAIHPTLAAPYQPITIIFAGTKRVTIWDVLGVQIGQYQLSGNINTIDAPNISGTYILRIENNNGEQRTTRIVVQ